ncbi:MAG TPA: glycosyltransferase family 2 protein, partial [Bacteroidetes bacterium]|nr:glycosyltransferase family 2 protein [Bacteroidota bacterium]
MPLLNQARHEHEKEYQEKEPLVSINIPTYSRGKLLVERTLPSIFAQTYERYEVVIVGDHCADNTAELIRKLNHPKVRFYDLPVRPVYPKNWRKFWLVAGTYACNKSLELSNGTWNAHLDDDDVFTPDHIEALLKLALEGDYELIKGQSRIERVPGKWEIGGKTGLPST